MFPASSSSSTLDLSHHHHPHSYYHGSHSSSLSLASSSLLDLNHSPSSHSHSPGGHHQGESINRWRGLFIPGLRRVLAQTCPSMRGGEDALDYVERLLLQLLAMICSRPSPHSVAELQDRVSKLFPHPVKEWAIEEATKALASSAKGGGGNKKKSTDHSSSSSSSQGTGVVLVYPLDFHPLLKEAINAHKLDHNVTLYVSAVLEYIAADVLHLVGNYVKHSRRGEFSTQDIKAAVYCDKVLCDLFKLGDTLATSSGLHSLSSSVSGGGGAAGLEEGEEGGSGGGGASSINSLSYSEVVEDLLQSERQYLRDLQMIIKVFREQLADKLEKENENLESVFQCIEDITELSVNLLSGVEDGLEAVSSETGGVPAVGNAFLELAENWEFDVYDRYAETYDEDCRRLLADLLSRPDVEKRVSTAGRGYVDAIKFYFPKLLLEPFYHATQYFDFIKLLYGLSPSEKDKTDLLQTDSILTPLQTTMTNLNIPKKAGDVNMRISGKGNKQLAQLKVEELKGLVEGFGESMGLGYFNEFFCEGDLIKISSGRRASSERYAFLFDGCIFLCKPNVRSRVGGAASLVMNMPGGGGHHRDKDGERHDLRLKEAFYLSRVEVHDRADDSAVSGGSNNNEDWPRHLFEIHPRDQPPILLSAPTPEEKRNWMANLVMLTTKSMLDRLLDRILLDEEKKHPLKLPSAEVYRFAVPDSDVNIVFDKDSTGTHLIIKGATLLKLVERLTHHQYSDPSFVNTFLTTYRSFCSPHEFLSLLIERFNIPEPLIPLEENPESIHVREMLKRFRKEYSRHIQLRVLNVIKQWVMHHFYDFERDPSLELALESFLESGSGGDSEGKGKNCIFESVRRCLRKAAESVHLNADSDRNLSAVKSPPPIEYHIRCPVSEWNILTLHPIELARQLSLLEFDYYRVVKPSELVGSVWTKKNKETQSPNLLKMIKHTTAVTRWFEKTIVDTESMEERVAVVSRILEVMIVMHELNNFNGVLAVVSAMGSASVHRLAFTFQGVSARLLRALEDAQELQNDHYKKYQERLRSINPPCVPFFGMYLTNILHIEEGNLDFLPHHSGELINFGKRRKVAEITSEIRQFQYSHYTYAVEPRIREYIEKLQPFPPDVTENEISNYLYEKSLEIEPRGAKVPPKFPRKWPDLNLKSPGIKRNGRIGMHHPGPLLPFSSLSQNSLSLASLTSTLTSASSRTLNSNLPSFTPDSSDPLLDHASQPHLSSAHSQQPTPKTPSSLHSPTSSPSETRDSNYGDFSIFAPVLIGSVPSTVDGGYCDPPPVPPRPPPRHPSTSTSSHQAAPPQHSTPDGPVVTHLTSSPRNGVVFSSSTTWDSLDMPPPLPPRKQSPRTPSTNPPIPRRNSASIPGGGGGELSPHANIITGPPQLPPHSSSSPITPSSPAKRLNHPPPPPTTTHQQQQQSSHNTKPVPPPHSPLSTTTTTTERSTGDKGRTSISSTTTTTSSSCRFQFTPPPGGGGTSPRPPPPPFSSSASNSPPKLPPKTHRPPPPH